MNQPSVQVVKVGGSLLEWPELPQALRAWLAAETADQQVIIAGGGRLADTVRRWDRQWALPSDVTHWACIELLSATARLVAEFVPDAAMIGEFAALREAMRSTGNGRWVLVVEDFLRRDEVSGEDALPHDWTVTSDSIAARLAHRLEADELVLLKSTLPKGVTDLREAARTGLVDSHFPLVANRLPAVRVVNLRDADRQERRLI